PRKRVIDQKKATEQTFIFGPFRRRLALPSQQWEFDGQNTRKKEESNQATHGAKRPSAGLVISRRPRTFFSSPAPGSTSPPWRTSHRRRCCRSGVYTRCGK